MPPADPVSQTCLDDSSPEKSLEAAPRLEQTYMESGLSREDAVFLASFPEDMRKRCIRKVNKSPHSICNSSESVVIFESRLIGVSALS